MSQRSVRHDIVSINHKTGQAKYVQHNVETRSRSNCCRGKAIGIRYSSVCA